MIALDVASAGVSIVSYRWSLRTSDRKADTPPPLRRREWAGALFGAAAGSTLAIRSPSAWISPTLAAFSGVSIALALVDIAEFRISRHVVREAAVTAIGGLLVASAATGHWGATLVALVAATVVYAAVFVLHLIAPHGFGYGDVRMGALCALVSGWLGWHVVVNGLLASMLIAGLVALVIVATGASARLTKLPFAPFLTAGFLVAALIA